MRPITSAAWAISRDSDDERQSLLAELEMHFAA